MREIGIIVDDVHARHVKGPMGTLGTQSLIFKDGTIVELKCKSTLMAFNTPVPTMEEVENLPQYQIAFKNWIPQRYYDELDINKTATSEIDTEKANTKATLFLSTQNSTTEHYVDNSISKPNEASYNNDKFSIDDSNSIIPIWDIEST